MIDAPKRSRKEIAYSVGLWVCLFGFFATVLTGLIFSLTGLISQSIDNVIGVWAFLLFAGILLFRWRLRTNEQRQRDEYALRLFNAARSGEITRFAVFLRPFYITKRIKISVSVPSAGPVTFHLEETLIKALSMPVVALGKPGEVYGAARILMNEDSWKSAASELMRRASIILCTPSSHPGSLWELDEILRNQYLGKTVFLMPRDPSHLWFKWKDMKNDWDAVVAHMENHGLRIPPYERIGLLFAIRPGEGCFIEDFSLTSSERLRAAIGRLSSPLPLSSGLAAA